jgi:tetratricopeptide (TPR) repeat protein
MKSNHGLRLALGAALLATLANGAAAQRGGRAGAVSLPSVTCASGATGGTHAMAAQGAYNRTLIPNLPTAQKQAFYQQAYDQAMQGVTTDANNPFNYFLAGQGAAGLGRLGQADSLFRKTVELCPEFADEVTPARAELGNAAMEQARAAFAERNDTTAAIAAWTLATQLDSTNVDARFYVGYFSLLRGDTQRAIPVFRQVLAAPAPAATDSDAVQRREVAVRAVLGYAGTLFNQNQNAPALEALNAVRAVDPRNHDANYWATLTLYKMQNWAELSRASSTVVELAPLNYNAYMLMHDAHVSLANALKARSAPAAQETQERNLAMRAQSQADSRPVQSELVTHTTQRTVTTVKGVAVGNNAPAGTPVRVEFILSTPLGDVGTGTVNIAAPAKEAQAPFEFPVTVTTAPTGFRYRVVR